MDIPKERISKRTREQFVDNPIVRVVKDFVEVVRVLLEVVQGQVVQVAKGIPPDRFLERVVEQIGVFLPHLFVEEGGCEGDS